MKEEEAMFISMDIIQENIKEKKLPWISTKLNAKGDKERKHLKNMYQDYRVNCTSHCKMWKLESSEPVTMIKL